MLRIFKLLLESLRPQEAVVENDDPEETSKEDIQVRDMDLEQRFRHASA